jgi:outer membrane immunogenic protein
MKKLLLGCAAAALLSAPALAADLPEAVTPVAPDVVSYSWTGGYVGIHGGYNFNSDDDDDDFGVDGFGVDRRVNGVNPQSVVITTPGIFNQPDDLAIFNLLNGDDSDGDDNGWEIGVRAGYDWQFGSFVVGAVVDANYMFDGDDDDDDNGLGFNGTFAQDRIAPLFSYGFADDDDDDGDWYATARLRAGFAADRVLIYGTAGLAFGGDSEDNDAVLIVNDPAAVVTTTTFSDDDDSNIGYAVGGGVEALVTSNVSVGLEYLYVNLDGFGDDDDDDLGAIARVVSPFNGTFDIAKDDGDENDFHTIRLGVNYRFGGVDAPVVASY